MNPEGRGGVLGCVESRDLENDPVWEEFLQELGKLDSRLSSKEIDVLHVYYIEERYIAAGNISKAREIYECTKTAAADVVNFEDRHPDLLAAVDIALKGDTNWDVKPAFRLSK